MASWTMPYRADTVESNRDSGFYWQDMEGSNDMQNDFFGQFVDFGGDDASTATPGDAFNDLGTMSAGPEPLFVMDDQQQQQGAESTASSGASTADEFDFLSNSSHLAPSALATSYEINPKMVTLGPESHDEEVEAQHYGYLGRGSMSETDLTRLESISLHSPQKTKASVSDPSSPTPPNTIATARKPKKFVEALSSTIRKATTLRKTRKALPEQKVRSPSLEQQQQQQQRQLQSPLKIPKQRRGRPNPSAHGLPQSPPVQQQNPGGAQFIHGYCEDPFNEGAPPPMPAAQYYNQPGIHTPIESPGVKLEQARFPNGSAAPGVQVPPAASWMAQQQQVMARQQWPAVPPGQDPAWWDLNMVTQNGAGEFANHHRNASLNLASHAHSSGLPYEYSAMPDTGAAGLMIHMPQPHPSQPTVVNDLTLNAHTYLPPPPPAMPTAPASERPHRPPRAKSSGARHLSCSPMRKQRAPSASPTPNQPQVINGPRSRHSSGGSVSSVRSSSGRLPGSMPGTPCSVRKRRSRDVSGSGGVSFGGDDGFGVGFVNFTPNDGSVLMTGVAPSGSSKTKARREKEAQDRRRRLSEAALKAVAAAGGDVDKLLEQGFTL
ncbi:hypothetical protein DCS_01422 [Drechmeria coniospora]|uniref:Developmental regulatory protein wetA n=1 Tax=Drechmeria coniospora TaxID=98403 RepID=A0A151GT54_DRECN|nr:hypothetical protein DCS_01422 [Drechmeria coniospora]KYK60285.1 hypothetical protein DCS_01422 [Drechmeria coniospora]